MKERWKEIKGNRETYEISSLGNIRTKDRKGVRGHHVKGHVLTQHDNSNGYLRCKGWKFCKYSFERRIDNND